jgi:YkoY family integral membrane protein
VHIEASDLFTVLLLVALEGLLSVDNAMVLAVLALGLPRGDQRKALRYGIFGAFAFRAVAVVLAIHLIQLAAIKLVGGAYLLWLPLRHFVGRADSGGQNPVPRARGWEWLGIGAFWTTVIRIELTDIVFAIDSIVAAVGMSSKTWVVLTGGVLGIMAMRLAIGQLLAVVERYPLLVDGAFVIVAWVGVKLVLEFLHTIGYVAFEIPRWLSLGPIVAIFVATLVYSIGVERRRARHRPARNAAELPVKSDDE